MNLGKLRLICATVVLVVWAVLDFLANLWDTQDYRGWDLSLTLLLIGWAICCCTDLPRSDV